ncbi:DEAD/DEAH box helicase [Paenibacillus sp. IB182496]|uniref:DNA 3'-5' helicase n=2 Tax=Paenibacillus sabuli TaxID=2772509 RepID=A0A927BSW2_9BACL|nr:DEAD/DEAH box helicase [Paenibacillus sabuli]
MTLDAQFRRTQEAAHDRPSHTAYPALIVQSDCTVLLDGRHPEQEAAADALSRFADLIKRPGDLHTYRISPLSVWNARAAGWTAEQMCDTLRRYGGGRAPERVAAQLTEWAGRCGRLSLEQRDDELCLTADDPQLLEALAGQAAVRAALAERRGASAWAVQPAERGRLKQELLRCGYPVQDRAGYHEGEALSVQLRDRGADARVALRAYQAAAVDTFYRPGDDPQLGGGSGVLVLPCGAGKTVIGIAALARLGCATLILTSNVTSVKQWKEELLDKTTLEEAQIGQYAGTRKQVRPVTIATYQILTHRSTSDQHYRHMGLFHERDWGLIIYDEVHLLPAPVFRMTAEIQATRRMGLTATLVREDGRERDVFSLIGPKRYDMPWKALERDGWIAEALCTELRVLLPDPQRYEEADARARLRLAYENPHKAEVVQALLERHAGLPTLVIGQYLNQLRLLAGQLDAPLLTGQTRHDERERLLAAFRRGEQRILIVSKVANFAVNLPDAAVAIQVSGSFGSRQEEAQRIGRILRPKRGDNRAWFYSLVSEATREAEFARRRQLFMIEQGYRYELVRWDAAAAAPSESRPAT